MKPAPPTLRNILAALVAGLAAFALARSFPSPPSSTAPKTTVKSPPAETSELPNTAAPVPGASVTAFETLFEEAEQEKDTFRAAEKSFAAIELLSAKDFAAFLEKRDLPMVFSSMNSVYGKALARALVERWLTVDPEGGFAAIIEMRELGPDGEGYRDYEELASVLAELRPSQFLAEVPLLKALRVPDPGALVGFRGEAPAHLAALTALAHTQPDAARRYLATLPQNGGSSFQKAFMRGLVESDPVGAVREARAYAVATEAEQVSAGQALPRLGSPPIEEAATAALKSAERTGLGTLRQVLTELGDDWPSGDEIPILCARYPSLAADLKFPETLTAVSSEVLTEVFERLPTEELRRRLEASDQLPEAVRDALFSSLTTAWAAREPREAIAWAMAHPKKGDDDLASLLSDAYAGWQEADPTAALAWRNALPESAFKKDLGDRGGLEAVERGDVELAMRMLAVETINPQVHRSEALPLFIAHVAAARAPRDAALWMAGLPHSERLARQMPAAVQGWYARDPGEVAEWVESLPAGSWRDEAAANLAATMQIEDPSATAEWLGVIGDAERRADEVGKVFDRYRRANPAQARAWLQEVPELTPEERLKFVRPWRVKKAEDSP